MLDKNKLFLFPEREAFLHTRVLLMLKPSLSAAVITCYDVGKCVKSGIYSQSAFSELYSSLLHYLYVY